MQICHDLKKGAEGVSPPLPSVAKLIPISFYVAASLCGFFAAYCFVQKNAEAKSRLVQEKITSDEKRKMAQVQTQHAALENDLKTAKAMIDWVKGSQALQPLATDIATAIQPGTNIVELTLGRRKENPWMIHLALELTGDLATGQLEDTIVQLQTKYQTFNPSKNQESPESISYKATLVPKDRPS